MASAEEAELLQGEFYNNYPAFVTDQQLKVLEITGVIAAVPSLVGSSLIIYSIFKENRYPERMYQRIMLGLSSIDWIVSSSWIFLGPWTIPQQVNFVLGAKAESFVFCSLSGFFMNFMMGALWYSASLSLFFALLVGHGLDETRIKKYFEPTMHTFGIITPLITGIYAISQEYMNPLPLLPGNCWMSFYCDEQVCRGMGFRPLSLICGAITVGITFIIVLISMIRIIFEVYKTEKKLRQYFIENNDTPPDDVTMVLTRETSVKALLYIGTFILTFAAGVGLQICPLEMSVENQTTYFVLQFLTKLLSPMQGFFNCLIYFRYKTPTHSLRSRSLGQANVMAFTEPHREPPSPALRRDSSFFFVMDQMTAKPN